MPMDANVTANQPAISDPSSPSADASRSGAGWRRWQVVLPVCLAAAIAGVLVRRSIVASAAKPAAVVRSVPVVTAVVRKGDMPVNISGLGTVVPTDAVTVRTRVDGQLMTVNFKEGQVVKQGDLLMQVDPRPYEVQLHQAEGQLAKDQAALKDARLDLERYKNLVKQGILPQQQLDTQVATVDQDEAAIKGDQAGVESAKLNLTYSRITAPLSGTVGLRLVDAGQHGPRHRHHRPGGDHPAFAHQRHVHHPRRQHPARAGQQQGAASPWRWTPSTGTTARSWPRAALLAVDNQVDPTTGTVRLKAQFPNKDGILFPNQFVNARLQTDTLHDVLIVPAAAVQRSPRGNFVYVVKPDSTVDLRTVEIELTEADTIALKSGVQESEQVVIDGLDKLSPGTKVAPTQAAAKVKP